MSMRQMDTHEHPPMKNKCIEEIVKLIIEQHRRVFKWVERSALNLKNKKKAPPLPNLEHITNIF